MNQEIRQEVLNLMDRKERIENEIKELTDVLHSNGVQMNDPLVDAEGYPINSIDIYQVRHARNKIICLQNDHKALMKEIEQGLYGYYSSSNLLANHDVEMEERSNKMVHKLPFAKINIVSDDSPAQFSGLNVGDELVEFGSINKGNFKSLSDIAAVVQHSEGKSLNVKVKRGDQFVTTELRPKRWKGRGLLGCNIIPLE
ncbi:26S proteasome non-ATPase regulatory subunit 9 [Coccinella septempunctata]|uniref:26S proteasome non-ATPase regulatory subunit 9 n=1 Tax=Coccinella septempunctata TaxID=41139 RepID=UPI001D0831BB|nr:26S proteasome non-ATPase regulatory subunit 9 [Coccinella septempunctata]